MAERTYGFSIPAPLYNTYWLLQQLRLAQYSLCEAYRPTTKEEFYMSMEKQGVIDDRTPTAQGPQKPQPNPGEPTTKQAADELEEHLTTKLADAAKSIPFATLPRRMQ